MTDREFLAAMRIAPMEGLTDEPWPTSSLAVFSAGPTLTGNAYLLKWPTFAEAMKALSEEELIRAMEKWHKRLNDRSVE